MPYITNILGDLVSQATFLVVLLIFFFWLVLFTYTKVFRKYFPNFSTIQSQNQLRLYLIWWDIFILNTILYWIIDTHFFNVPDPVLPFALYVLITTLIFGLRYSIYQAVVGSIIIDYYLFEPRYTLFLVDHQLSDYLSVLGIVIAGAIGVIIRHYQLRITEQNLELKRLMQARDQLSYSLVHDLKNPLSAIKLYSSQIAKHNGYHVEKRVASSIEILDYEVDKLLNMVNTMLDFTRIQSGKFTIKPELIDLVKICDEKISVMRSLNPQYDFKYFKHPKHLIINASPIAFDRIITNLLVNAVKYSPPQTSICLKTYKQPPEICIEVSDQGVGIDQNQLKKIFEPFHQGSQSTEGLGLGLYITSELARLQQGHIKVTSQPGKGSTFTVSFPDSSLI